MNIILTNFYTYANNLVGLLMLLLVLYFITAVLNTEFNCMVYELLGYNHLPLEHSNIKLIRPSDDRRTVYITPKLVENRLKPLVLSHLLYMYTKSD